MTIYSDPPSLRDFKYDKPTLLVCWWATSMSTLIILLRLAGRFIRTERLFTEDRVAAAALIPLYARMACVHFILLYGTNNADFDGVDLTHEQLRQKQIASGLVLLSRVFYAATLWVLKNATLEFLFRLTLATWERSWQTTLRVIRVILIATFIVVVISDLVECRPFDHYWQVSPDPGGKCRQGYVQLIAMACCNVFTDLLLVIFPIPIIVTSKMTIKRKVQLVALFSLSLGVVGVTLYRVPHIVRNQGRQQYRSLLASVEILFAMAAANALVLGSFVRDRGLKKQKFRRTSVAESFEPSLHARRPTLQRYWGSDEDLVRDVGMTLEPGLRDRPDSSDGNPAIQFTPAPIFRKIDQDLELWQFPKRQLSNAERSATDRSDDSLVPRDALAHSHIDTQITPRRVSFFDVGGLLDTPLEGKEGGRESYSSSNNDSLLSPPGASINSNGSIRRGSTALLQDLGGFLGPLHPRQPRPRPPSGGTELQTIPQEQGVEYNIHGQREAELQDPGGLLEHK